MKNSALLFIGLLPLSAACTAETAPPTAPDGEGAHATVASAVVTSGGHIPCHFTVAGCAGARFVHHLPGVGFVGDGTPPDPSNYGSCTSGCAGLESSCVDACATGGVF